MDIFVSLPSFAHPAGVSLYDERSQFRAVMRSFGDNVAVNDYVFVNVAWRGGSGASPLTVCNIVKLLKTNNDIIATIEPGTDNFLGHWYTENEELFDNESNFWRRVSNKPYSKSVVDIHNLMSETPPETLRKLTMDGVINEQITLAIPTALNCGGYLPLISDRYQVSDGVFDWRLVGVSESGYFWESANHSELGGFFPNLVRGHFEPVLRYIGEGILDSSHLRVKHPLFLFAPDSRQGALFKFRFDDVISGQNIEDFRPEYFRSYPVALVDDLNPLVGFVPPDKQIITSVEFWRSQHLKLTQEWHLSETPYGKKLSWRDFDGILRDVEQSNDIIDGFSGVVLTRHYFFVRVTEGINEFLHLPLADDRIDEGVSAFPFFPLLSMQGGVSLVAALSGASNIKYNCEVNT